MENIAANKLLRAAVIVSIVKNILPTWEYVARVSSGLFDIEKI